MNSITRDLSQEGEAARSLLLNIRDVIGDDEIAQQDAIEGETNLAEAASRAVERISEIEALGEAIKAQREKLGDRADRLKRQGETLRAALAAALGQAGVRRLELPYATVSLRPTQPKVIISDEAAIPAEFWKRSDPTLDKSSLLKALKEPRQVPGAELSNGGETISIKEG